MLCSNSRNRLTLFYTSLLRMKSRVIRIHKSLWSVHNLHRVKLKRKIHRSCSIHAKLLLSHKLVGCLEHSKISGKTCIKIEKKPKLTKRVYNEKKLSKKAEKRRANANKTRAKFGKKPE